MKNIFVRLFFVLSCFLCFHSCSNITESVINTLNKDLQFRIDTLLVDDTILVTEITYDYLFQQLEQVVIDTSIDLLRFGEQDFFVSQYGNQYILANADPDLDPDLEQVFYFIITKRIVYDLFYGEMRVLEIIKKEENH